MGLHWIVPNLKVSRILTGEGVHSVRCSFCHVQEEDFGFGAGWQHLVDQIVIVKEYFMPATEQIPKQLLHLVFGGELTELDSVTFRDLDGLDVVGIFPDYATAYDAWKQAAQSSVDNAHMRYFIVHMHKLLEPDGVKG